MNLLKDLTVMIKIYVIIKILKPKFILRPKFFSLGNIEWYLFHRKDEKEYIEFSNLVSFFFHVRFSTTIF